jgi:hypothetical protein
MRDGGHLVVQFGGRADSISVAAFHFSLGTPFADRDELDGDHQTRNSSLVTKP